jgi:hypothetical protein
MLVVHARAATLAEAHLSKLRIASAGAKVALICGSAVGRALLWLGPWRRWCRRYGYSDLGYHGREHGLLATMALSTGTIDFASDQAAI